MGGIFGFGIKITKHIPRHHSPTKIPKHAGWTHTNNHGKLTLAKKIWPASVLSPATLSSRIPLMHAFDCGLPSFHL